MSPKNKYVYICVEYIYIYFAKIHKQSTLSSDTTKMFVLIDNVLAYLLEQDDLFVTARFAIQGQIVSRRVNKIHISNITDVLLQQFISHTLPYNDNIVPKKILDSMRTAVRQLLEATACVSRECPLVKRSQDIKRARKRLLSDWYRLGADANMDAVLLVINSAWRFLAVWRPFVNSIQHATQELYQNIAHYLLHGNVNIQRVTALIQLVMGQDDLLFSMDDVLQEVFTIQLYLNKMLPHNSHKWQKPSPFDSANLLLNFRDWTTDNALLQELLLSYPTINKNKHKNHSVPRLIQIWVESYWQDSETTLKDILNFWYSHLAEYYEYQELFADIVQLFINKKRTRQLKIHYIGLTDKEIEENKPPLDYENLFLQYEIDKTNANDELCGATDLSDLLFQWKQGELLEVEAFALNVSPWSLAKTLTLLESSLYLDIETIEFTRHFKHNDTTIDSVFTLSNQLSSYVLETTLQQTHTISYWLQVALSCLYLRNLNSLASIITSLQNHSIERLSLPIDVKSDHLFQRLKVVVHPNNNYNVYRRTIKHIFHSQLPCVPFTSLLIRDITFIRDGNDTFTKDGNNVNMQKFNQITKIVAFAQYLQQKQYEDIHCSNTTARSLLGAMIKVHTLYNDNKDRAYQVSIAKVPRLT
ncbi:AAC_HP2_G0005710.mRNA.1.CDS.1 [Saccharomyces cerevisiae]|nr:AAC_HP2_G0005710.mRNA.1.CDS.1 [Saccharomyces cerevisiae]CAI6410550.1 AAC_HP2_G0005710.mRNA.1.CDS.1 [Saccharomyces cerevisiae]